ncbi:ABC transporter A, ABCA, partial [Kipferlia bialata]
YVTGFEWFVNTNPLVPLAIFWGYLFAADMFTLLVTSICGSVRISVLLTIVVLLGLLVGGMLAMQYRYTVFEDDSSDAPSTVARWFMMLLYPLDFSQVLYLVSAKSMPFLNDSTGLPDAIPGFHIDDFFAQDAANGIGLMGSPAFMTGSLWVCAIIYVLVAAYLDAILPAAHGSSRPIFFPFTLDFWGATTPPPPPNVSPMYEVPPPMEEWDSDVTREAAKCLAKPGTREFSLMNNTSRTSVLIMDLMCIFRKLPIFRLRGDKVAVDRLNLSIQSGSVFGLLGHNGAGKTTTINILTGCLRPSGGYAKIMGFSVKEQAARVARIMGYAPQHDVLWPDLTCGEHIRLFSKLKGVDPAADLHALDMQRKEALQAGLMSASAMENSQ